MGLRSARTAAASRWRRKYQLQWLDSALPPGHATDTGYDALDMPHIAGTAGDLDAQDTVFGPPLRPIFVDSLFGCIRRPAMVTASNRRSGRLTTS
ncbi:TIGR03032 family protein [Sphingomonas sp. SUN039]|uniref:TIGR03032 family protein n=1 Tax=Sphingomonas sp. SUN039 TaxID=2937787 RepID=UPI002164252D|nr:TIGR03032 family protein [Sphingomonas sp. SUN039]UVO55775.1 TIGR03032 family protein [Sphingomonas sp. SUN039]